MYNHKSNISSFEKFHFDPELEKVQTKFGKFSLNISKYASSHGIRAELRLFPMKIFTDIGWFG